VPQHLTDLGQRPTRVQHRRGRGMPQSVRRNLAQTGTTGRGQHHRGHSVGGQRPVRSLRPHEHRAARRRRRAAVLQVGHDGLPHIGRQRQPILPMTLTPHDQLTAPPVDVLQRQGRDLTGA